MNPMTRANLEAALAGEALTALRYRCFADAAADEGLDEVARLFNQLAAEELGGHAAALATALGIPGPTRENLVRAIERETGKHQRRYAEYASAADRVGDCEVADLFERLAGDERRHAEKLRTSLGALVSHQMLDPAPAAPIPRLRAGSC